MPSALDRQHADQQEAGVGDRRVGQHPLDVGLRDRDDRADQHREDRDAPHHRPPVPADRAQRDVEDPQQRAERGHLGARGHERGDRGGRALVDVRGPLVERRGADLEQQADGDAAPPRRAAAGRGRPWPRRPGRCRRSRSVPEKPYSSAAPYRKNADENAPSRKYFSDGLLREQPAAPGHAGQQVQRQREHLEGDEHGEQVVGRGEQHHAAERRTSPAGRPRSG